MKILKINSSGSKATSVSRQYVEQLVAKLVEKNEGCEVVDRDVAYDNLPFVDETMIGGYFSPEPNAAQQEALVLSNSLVEELKSADVLVIGCPIYNFGMPASLKAYIDLISRAGLTFKITSEGFVGLAGNKKTYIVVSSGGTTIGSPYDFATGHLRALLGILGITDLEFVHLDEMGQKGKEKAAAAVAFIDAL